MDLTWSLDEVARTSDDVVVRTRFAERNRTWLVALLIFFAFVCFINLVEDHRDKTPLDVLLTTLNFAFIGYSLFFMRYTRRRDDAPDTLPWRVGAFLRRHTNAASIAFAMIQFLLAISYVHREDSWFGWTLAFPLLMLGFRMLVSELVLLHLFFVGASLILSFILPGPREGAPLWLIVPLVNGVALSVELYLSRRMRRQVIGDFTSRRTSAREQIRMRDELRYARELQLSMLPECAPNLGWADICSISVPATEVGGDYYDYFVDGDRVALVCGDVAGHGMAAGLVLSAMRSGFTLLRDSLHDPAVVLRRLHGLVAETSRRRMLVTVSVVLLDSKSNQATIASAGNPPVLVRRTNGEVETIELFAPPLGVRLPVEIPQITIPFTPGDVFVLHSDGIYETRNDRDEVYGIERLVQLVAAHGEEPPETLRDTILTDVADFRGEVEQADDVTLVVCAIR